MKPRYFRALLATLASTAALAWIPGASAQPCTCTNASMIGTQANVHYANYSPSTDWNGTVVNSVEMPASSNPLQWNSSQRFNVDILANKLRVEFAVDAYYGQGTPVGSQFKFMLNPVAPAPCGAAKIVGASFTTNRADASNYINAQSSFSSSPNSVTIVFGNGGPSPFADWRKNDWIEAQLKFDCANSVSMPLHGVTTVTPGPVNVCTPYQLCFDVNVPNTAVASGQAALSLQLTQNGFPVGVPITATVTQDGIKCFQLPALPAGTGYDYLLTSTFTYPGVPSQTTTTQSPVQGINNDLVCSSGTPMSTCCPPLTGGAYMEGMFIKGAHTPGQQYQYTLATGSANWISFHANLLAYWNYLKLICPTVTSLKATFDVMNADGSPGNFFGSPLSSFSMTCSGSICPTPTWAGVTLHSNTPGNGTSVSPSPTAYGVKAMIVALGANGQPVVCGFDSAICAQGDSFKFEEHTSLFKVTNPNGQTK